VELGTVSVTVFIYTIISIIAAFYLLWTLFLAYASVNLAYTKKIAPKYVIWLSAPILVAGLCVDVAINVILMTIIMAEFPKEYTVSTRIHRHRSSTGYRKFIANLFVPFLNSFEKDHV
jgi:hypothetical protein